MGVLAGFLLLCILVIVHEFGHFWVAKLLGVRVQVFSVGFGPKLFKWTRGETEYAFSLVPLGGYVKMLGESPDEELSEEDQKRSFLGQPIWRKSLIAFAGPLFNLVLPVVLFFGILVGNHEIPQPVIGEVIAGKAGEKYGLKVGDKVISIDGKPISTFMELVDQVSHHPGKELHLTLENDHVVRDVIVVPDSEGKVGRLGVMLSETAPTTLHHVGIAKALKESLSKTWEMIRLTVVSLWMLATGQVSPKELGGPLMIIGAAGQAASQGLAYYLQLMALISVNLGLLNLLPVPVLDGGHLLMFGVEAVIRRPLSMRVRQIVTQIGLFLLISLMVIALFNDVVRLIH